MSYYGLTNIPASLTNVVAIAAGFLHNVALKSEGTVVSWGYNGDGQTNVPAGLTGVIGISSGGFHNLVITSNRTVLAWGYNTDYQTNVPAGLTNVAAVAAGGFHSLALQNDGTVVAWGAGTNYTGGHYGQALTPAGLNNVVAIAAGGHHSLALRGDGTVVAWGAGTNNTGTFPNYGQSMVSSGLSNVLAIAAGGGDFGGHSLALLRDGTVVGWGRNNYGQTNTPIVFTNLVTIASGYSNNLAISVPLAIESIALPGQHPVIRFHTFSNRKYSVQYSLNISDTIWDDLPGVSVVGDGYDVQIPDTNIATIVPTRYYRLREY